MSERPPRRRVELSHGDTSLERQLERQGELRLRDFSLQDLHEIRLLLRGDSIIDWHRLLVETEDDARRLLRVNSFDVDVPDDVTRLEHLRDQAVRYIRETLGLKLDDAVARDSRASELPLLASRHGDVQRQACTLLKVMHIIHHLDARELRLALPLPDSDLYAMVEESVTRLFDELRTAGVPLVEFAWSRKSKGSLITKLLVKRETYAAQVFDRLRFRLVVEHERDLFPTLHLMLHRFVPFNYVVPGQTVNSLIDVAQLEHHIDPSRDVSTVPPPLATGRNNNEFSARGYQVLNFVADLPVRIDSKLGPDAPPGKILFVLAEFQIMDRARALANEEGESSHDEYKRRQHQRVRERLLREPKKNSGR